MGRVEAVDVDRQIGGAATDPGEDALDRGRHAQVVDRIAVDDLDPEVVRRMGADADLDRAGGLDQPRAHRTGDEGAVVEPVAVVVPGILMRVELHQRQWAMPGGVRLQQRPGDEMIAAEADQMHALRR